MKLINNDDTLRQYMPNVFATVKGEVSLFDKVNIDLDLIKERYLAFDRCEHIR